MKQLNGGCMDKDKIIEKVNALPNICKEAKEGILEILAEVIGESLQPKKVELDLSKIRLTMDRESVEIRYNDWYILRLNADGTLYRCPNIPCRLGFKIGSFGRIRLVE